MDIHALIIAGGVGARFWPRSRERSPKQLLRILGEGTMIQNTVARLNPIVPEQNILIITNALQADEVQRQLPQIPPENIIIEPAGRNTAPAVALGAEILTKRHGDAKMIVLPSDHIIHDVKEFHNVLDRAVRLADEQDGLVTIGIKPTHPETGYGYIQFDNDESEERDLHGGHPVKTFAEKPNLATAEKFLASGDFVWNSGMFIWKASTVRRSIAEFLPDISDEIQRLHGSVDTDRFYHDLEVAYREMRGISIDYGIMEKAENRYVIPADFGWNDLGSWDEVYRLKEKDGTGIAEEGTVISIDVNNAHLVAGEGRVLAAIGVEDVSIIDTNDSVLVFKHGHSQTVKEVVDYLRKNNMSDYL
ncbi:MAG: mannose-1-phosphate guanylyltransferase [Ectothiorhodospiraceae bacterium]|nr:mannose-1-phosphate guanylyltransferase [Ectothiorhodospiraceae bacterium]